MKLKTVAVFMLLGLSVSGCDYIPTPKNKALRSVSERMIDPSSTKFSDVFEGIKEGSYCGYVNAKNRMGAYAGSNVFIYEKIYDDIGIVFLASEPLADRDFKNLLTYSGSDFSDEYWEKISQGCKFTSKWDSVCGTRSPISEHRLCAAYRGGSFIEALYEEFEH